MLVQAYYGSPYYCIFVDGCQLGKNCNNSACRAYCGNEFMGRMLLQKR